MAACRGPRLPILLGCAPKALVRAIPQRRGETRREFPLARLSHISANPGRGMGRGCGAAASSPMRQSAASLRRDAHPAGEWRAWGEQPAALEPVLPPHPALGLQLKVHTSHQHKIPAIPCTFSTSSRFFLLRPEAQKKKAIKKENAERSFALCGSRGGLRALHCAAF